MSIYLFIPLLPLLAFLILALGGKSLGESSHKVGVPAVGLTVALSIGAFFSVAAGGPISIPIYRLVDVGSLAVDVDLYVDQLTVLLLLLVTAGSFVVHVYSVRYMIGDPKYSRFFALMSLFTFAMVMLVMSNNLLVTYMCWEIMGICSYLLISHWAHRESACRAATKAFLVNAVADVGLGFGVILTLATYGTLDIQEILAAAAGAGGSGINLLAWTGFEWMVESNTLITLCLLVGALGKSAQFPLHVWLPFAMEAPTPISALIHAATMVNAGPFLLVRLSPLVMLAPSAMTVIAIVGAVTALFGGLVALTQSDIKRLLAYSTISQIGFMIFACGVGAFVVAIFHLLAHGFLKGFLFLSTGDALWSATAHGHAEDEEGSGSAKPVAPSLLFGTLLLACIPPLVLFSGTYERMWSAHHLPSAQIAFWVIALGTVFLTAAYTFRAVVSLFQQGLGRPGAAGPGSEVVRPSLFSPPHVLGTGLLTALVGCLLVFLWSRFTAFLVPAIGAQTGGLSQSSGGFSPWLVAPFLAAVGGWSVAWYLRRSRGFAAVGHGKWAGTLYVLLLNKLYIDDIYDVCVVKPAIRFSGWLWRQVDLRGVDRLVGGIAGFFRSFSRWLGREVDSRGIDGLVQGIARSLLRLSEWLSTVIELQAVEQTVRQSASGWVSLSRWLWRVVDIRGTDQAVQQLGRLKDGTGEALQRIEPRTLQHNLVVVVVWLVLVISLLYWLVYENT